MAFGFQECDRGKLFVGGFVALGLALNPDGLAAIGSNDEIRNANRLRGALVHAAADVIPASAFAQSDNVVVQFALGFHRINRIRHPA